MKLRALAVVATALAAVLAGGVPASLQAASAAGQTIDLDLALADTVDLDATLAVEDLSVEGDTVTVTGELDGTATLLGTTVDIATQPFTLDATVTCKRGTGTLTLSTSRIQGSVDGKTVTIEPATVTATADCGRTPTLSVTAEPLGAAVDGTSVSTSKCTVTVSGEAGTSVGTSICDVKELICELAELIEDTPVRTEDVVELLDSTIAQLGDSLTLQL